MDIFFVISGYLITLLFLRDVGLKGLINLKGFYLRRFRRLFPSFYWSLLLLRRLAIFSSKTLSLNKSVSQFFPLRLKSWNLNLFVTMKAIRI